jgi:hypothetical protein
MQTLLDEYNSIITDLKVVFQDGTTVEEYNRLVYRMREFMNDEKEYIFDTDYKTLKEAILELHQYPKDYDFDFQGHGPEYIRFCTYFKN